MREVRLSEMVIEERYPRRYKHEAFDALVAREVKLSLGEGYYVEYRLFREISIKDGEAVELEVPAFITDLMR